MGFRKWQPHQVPTKLTVVGNQYEGRKWIGAATAQLNILENQMSFQGLTQGHRTVQVSEDIIVECIRVFNIAEIVIHAIMSGGEKRSPWEEYWCWCSCNYTFGRITKETILGWDSIDRVYDLEGCQKSGDLFQFVELYNIPPLDFAHYLKDESVIVLFGTFDSICEGASPNAERSCQSPIAPDSWRITNLLFKGLTVEKKRVYDV